MKRACLIFGLLCLAFAVGAQEYPPEWSKYTFGGYLYDIQSDSNDRNLSETDFKNYLLNIARTNLAKQIQIRVQDVAELNKVSVNGRTGMTYSSNTTYSTDVNLKLVETRTEYNALTKTGSAIAYIDRDAARSYYSNELSLILNKINSAITVAETFVASGFKAKAQTELEASLTQLPAVEEPLFWMNIFGTSQVVLTDWQDRINTAEQTVKRMLADLKHSTVIYLSCKADIFGKPYSALQDELKGVLAADGCSFTDNPSNADWVITVKCTTREYSHVVTGNTGSYFAYVDAQIIIDKTITSQRIYEDAVSIKGGHVFGYPEAARAGYKESKTTLGEIIKKAIKQ